MYSKVVCLVFLFISIQCNAVDFLSSESQNNSTQISTAIKWYTISAEKKAIYNQIYKYASNYVVAKVDADHLQKKTWGVIIDIDETSLDSSIFEKSCGNLCASSDVFSQYVIKDISTALPGAKQFTCQVQKLGGYVSFVTNRDGSYVDKSGNVLDSTVRNLTKEGFCFDQVVLSGSPNLNDKNPRFKAIETGKYDLNLMVVTNKLPAHKVIAYLGDNIQDFPELKQSKIKGMPANDSIFNKFGDGYFIFPNPMYGSWQ